MTTSHGNQVNNLDIVKTAKSSEIIAHLNSLKKENKLLYLSKEVDAQGNTFLHLAIINHTKITVEELKEIIKILDDAILIMHQTVNLNGRTPMEVASELPESIKTTVLELLLPSALKATEMIISVKQPNYAESLKEYKIPADSKLAANLKMGYDAIIFCENHISKSASHPNCNSISSAEQITISNTIAQLRRNNFQLGSIDYKTYAENISKVQTGNCGEYAELSAYFCLQKLKCYMNCIINFVSDTGSTSYYFIAINYSGPDLKSMDPSKWDDDTALVCIKERNPASSWKFSVECDSSLLNPTIYAILGGSQHATLTPDELKSNIDQIEVFDIGTTKVSVPVETVIISNGDHQVTLLGRDVESTVENPGNDAVIIDAWAKRAYPAAQLKYKLHDYYQIETAKKFNLLTNYNERYHALKTARVLRHESYKFKLADPDKKQNLPKKSPIADNKKNEKSDNDIFKLFSMKAKKPKLIITRQHDLAKNSRTLGELLNKTTQFLMSKTF
jgi:hypothetical protein